MNIALRNGMLTVEKMVAAPAPAVWDVLTDLDAWPQWGPSVQRAELDEPGPLRRGSQGKVWTPLGISLPFTITEFDAGRSWAWEVAGVGATRHEVRAADGGSVVAFGVPWWAPAYLPICAMALPRIARLAGARHSG